MGRAGAAPDDAWGNIVVPRRGFGEDTRGGGRIGQVGRYVVEALRR